MISKITAFMALLKRGKIVANPQAWKYGQITVSSISALIIAGFALLKTYGVEIDLSHEQIDSIALIIVTFNGLFHPVATVVSSKKVGLPAKREINSVRQSHGMPGFDD